MSPRGRKFLEEEVEEKEEEEEQHYHYTNTVLGDPSFGFDFREMQQLETTYRPWFLPSTVTFQNKRDNSRDITFESIATPSLLISFHLLGSQLSVPPNRRTL
ncbi:hypothetical protein HZH66_005716 [Vespula vulgaris]|uniref:Uncharacterized protein n=1 Tax=Vespula vulgaris TaxID=7454 RepID=A0A834N8W2_VESVU|nr:hypothetical protein HZH66_005716 [Vespula vulgaris]